MRVKPSRPIRLKKSRLQQLLERAVFYPAERKVLCKPAIPGVSLVEEHYMAEEILTLRKMVRTAQPHEP